jgi:DNA modification methylase
MTVRFITADVLEGLRQLPEESVHCVVTSPPYWGLRDYGVAGQIGLEPTPAAFIARMVEVFREVQRVLRKDGTLWLNLGDSYAGYHGNKNAEVPTSATNGWTNGTNENLRTSSANRNGLKAKDLIGIPWRVAFALQADGWWLRRDIIWAKPNPMPESVEDRPTTAHEYMFLLTKAERYFYDAVAVREAATAQTLHDATGPGYSAPGQAPHGGNRIGAKGNANTFRGGSYVNGKPGPRTVSGNVRRVRDCADGHARPPGSPVHSLSAFEAENGAEYYSRNKRSVWTIATVPYPEAHFATFPPALVEPCIKAGCPEGGTILDPFSGAGTAAMVADRLGRDAIGIELNPDYVAMAERRLARDRLERKQGTMADVAAAQLPLTPLEELMQGGES